MDTSIHTLITKRLMGTISTEEKEYLQEWIDNHPGEKAKYEKLLNSTVLAERYMQYTQVDADKAWEKLQAQIHEHTETEENLSSTKRTSIIHLLRHPTFLRIAAVVALLIVGGAFLYHREYIKVTPPVITENVQTAMLQSKESGHHDAEIITSKTANKDLISQEDLALYHVDDNFVEQLTAATRITTYHNKEYWTQLSDGTLVHLNYNSRLIYPEKFGRGDRNVILDGEAYFMVAKDRSRPFIVHIPGGSIKVYGTEFNVNTSESPSVVLIKGSISVTPTEGKEQILKPGEQATFNQQSSTFIIEPTNVEPYIAWNTGDFVFHEWPLSRIMNIMSKWYNVDVEFSDEEVANKKLNGIFSRYSNIEETMETIKIVTGFTILINNNHIIIKK